MADEEETRPEEVRPVWIDEPMIYVSDLAVLPGQNISAHVTSPAGFQVSISHIPPRLVALDPRRAKTMTREIVREHHTLASRQAVRPGSYIAVPGSVGPERELSLAAWVRLWRVPTIDTVQWAWSSVVGDLDYPAACRFCLLVDHAGRVGFYIGDAGFDHSSLLTGGDVLSRLGEWVHVAGVLDAEGRASVYVDGEVVATAPGQQLGPATSGSSILMGASFERGMVDDFLDGDIAQVVVATSALTESDVKRIVESRGRVPFRTLTSAGFRLWGVWDFEVPTDRLADSSGNGNHGTAVNCPVMEVGGPAFDRSCGERGYDPGEDANRGGAVRLASDDLIDAGWPAALTWAVPGDAPSGIYTARLQLDGQDPSLGMDAPFVVSRRTPREPASVALLCATNTWLAYGRRPRETHFTQGLASSFYSTHVSGNPHFHVGFRLPLPQVDPFGYESPRAAQTNHSHLVRPELCGLAWLERRNIPHEAITDLDLHEEPDLLDRFAGLVIAGHNEYWTDEMRSAIDDYLSRGGAVLSLSGNTGSWRVTFQSQVRMLESRKVVGVPDRRWLTPETWGERWHCHGGGAGGGFGPTLRQGADGPPGPALLNSTPVHEILGVETQGMIDDGVATAFRGFLVAEPEHFLFNEPHRVHIPNDSLIGTSSANGPAVSGFEFDATALRLGLRQEHPEGLVVLASAVGQHNLEWSGADSSQGGEIVYWERAKGGTVFAVGAIGATGGLLTDRSIDMLTVNVLEHLGIPVRRLD